MDRSAPGPSNPRKTNRTYKNPNKLTAEELLAALESSDEENEYDLLESSDDDFVLDSESEGEDDDLVDTDIFANVAGTAQGAENQPESVFEPKWTDGPIVMKEFQFSKINGLLVPTPEDNQPVDYFRLLFNDEIVNLIVTETNRYAEEIFFGERISEHSRITKWKPVDKDEMLTYIGLVLHMGTIKLNRIQDYWKKHPLFNLTCFSSHMSRDRFLLLTRCLHFANNASQGENAADRLFKIRPIMNFFNSMMESIYYPGKNLSLDESMVLFRGRLLFRQYIKNKRHKYGIKLYMLTEPNGLILKSLVYTGALDALGGKGHTVKVVIELTKNYLDSGHSIYMDNFYNSFELARQLTDHSTYCTGTLNVKRLHNPVHVLHKKLKKGECTVTYSNNIIIGKWRDKRDVLFISNEYTGEMVEYVDRRGRTRQKPNAIYHYNKHMGGVDRQDQLNSYYPSQRKSLRWYKKIGFHFIQLMVLNSYLLFAKYSGRKMTLYDFRQSLLCSLLKIEAPRAEPQRKRTRHTLTKISLQEQCGRTKRKRCRVCSQQKIRKSTLYHCESCPDNPGFCVECFDIGHAE